ncbi:glycine-rich protein [Olsenella intestinalis]|uniref:glycine-rich protein n=1 Tax=Olsenella intestinalis TaxID=2930083 RepID=UPI00200EA285|nr:glycine-rich protein [Olsenella intestinalis]
MSDQVADQAQDPSVALEEPADATSEPRGDERKDEATGQSQKEADGGADTDAQRDPLQKERIQQGSLPTALDDTIDTRTESPLIRDLNPTEPPVQQSGLPVGRLSVEHEPLYLQSEEITPGENKTVSRTSTNASFTTPGTQYIATLADAGLYHLGASGAKGGASGENAEAEGGNGGSTVAVTPLDAGTLYVVTGGMGKTETERFATSPGGANGGGNGGHGNRYNVGLPNEEYYGGGGSGGGATHIATAPGALSDFGSTTGVSASVLLVAGGGGGGGAKKVGGAGGGASGGTGTRFINNGDTTTTGDVEPGSQAPSGSHVIGQGTTGGDGVEGNVDLKGASEGHGGGGGGYWGGAAISESGAWTKASGAGGSGYLNELKLAGEKSADGGSMTNDGAMVAQTSAGRNEGGGTASIEYLANIVTLDAGKAATTAGSPYVYTAPSADEYHLNYSLSGLGDQVDSITVPTRDDAVFLGYYTEPNGGGTRYINDTGTIEAGLSSLGTTTLYANWAPISYQVDFYSFNKPVGSQEFRYSEGSKALRTAEDLGLAEEGMTFAGWRMGPTLRVDLTDGEIVKDLPASEGHVSLYAVWKRQINFHAIQDEAAALRESADSTPLSNSDLYVSQLTDGEAYSSITAPILPAAGTWEGIGWVASDVAASAADVAAGESFMPMATEYFGLYHRELHLAFDGNGATSGTMDDLVDLQRMNASGQITSVMFKLPENAFERDGHTFRTWDLGDPGDAVTLSPAATEAATTTARALWDELPTPEAPGDPANTAQPQDRRSPSPATGDAPAWPAALAAMLAAAALTLGLSRRARREH